MIRLRRRLRGSAACVSAATLVLALCACTTDAQSTLPPSEATGSQTPSASPRPSVSDTGRIENATGTAVQTAPRELGPGETFQPLQYTIAPGDTLIGIDTRFQTCRDDIAALNSDFDAYNLQPGRTLTLGRTSEQPFTTSCA